MEEAEFDILVLSMGTVRDGVAEFDGEDAGPVLRNGRISSRTRTAVVMCCIILLLFWAIPLRPEDHHFVSLEHWRA